MPTIRVLAESDLRAAVGFGEEELAAIEAVYPLISSGEASMPPIMRIDVPQHNGEIDIKSAHLPGYDGIAVKISAGFFDNPRLGLPSLGGLMVVLNAETGIPRAVLFDNGFLTDLRTALAGAIAAKYLSKPDSTVAAILGGGVQARLQLEALTTVRPIERALVWARRPEQAERFAIDVGRHLGLAVEPVVGVLQAVQAADIVVTTTPAMTPLIDESMLHPGLHITAIGSDTENKQELAGTAVLAASRFVCDSIAQSGRLGEMRGAIESGFDAASAVELGNVISGAAVGRGSDDDVTICDLTGTGAQDTAIASLAMTRCSQQDSGTSIDA